MGDTELELFEKFFYEVNGHPPFPWQLSLTGKLLRGEWPEALNVGTGLGKTVLIDILVFLQSVRPQAPSRIVFTVDRRTLVDAAYLRSQRLADLLAKPEKSEALQTVADGLKLRAGEEQENPLIVSRLRGGGIRDDDWRTATVPAVVVGTVDQIGSRLLFRGYGTRLRVRPMEAGLLGMDSVLLLDEPHLSTAFLDSLYSIRRYQQQSQVPGVQPLRVMVLGATLPLPAPGGAETSAAITHRLGPEDFEHPLIRRRRQQLKPLAIASKPYEASDYARLARERLEDVVRSGGQSLAVMVNTVDLARQIHTHLTSSSGGSRVLLVIGRNRPAERELLEEDLRAAVGREGGPDEPLIVVSTQTLESGADLSFDALITESAPWPNIVQRVGRVARWGTGRQAPVLLVPSRGKHPAYGTAEKATLEFLRAQLEQNEEFGLDQDTIDSLEVPEKAWPERLNAPLMQPHHLATWQITLPPLRPDLDVAPFLHGARSAEDDLRVHWRRDVLSSMEGYDPELVRSRGLESNALGLDVLPLRAGETLEIPVGRFRDFLARQVSAVSQNPLADDVTVAEKQKIRGVISTEGLLIWKQADNGQGTWSSDPGLLRPGATVLLDSSRGGLDEFGWNPGIVTPVPDVAEVSPGAAGRQFRLSSLISWLGSYGWESLADRLVDSFAELRSGWNAWSGGTSEEVRNDLLGAVRQDVLAVLRELAEEISPGQLAESGQFGRMLGEVLGALEIDLMSEPGSAIDISALSPGWFDPAGIPRDLVFGRATMDRGWYSDDSRVTLAEHGEHAAGLAERIAKSRNLPESLRTSIVAAALHHDDGKARAEWQGFIGFVSGEPLAKGPAGTNPSRRWLQYGLERAWRHEALSAHMLTQAGYDDLVVHLAGAHHGWGRPFFPPISGRPETTATEATYRRFERLSGEYGPWGLAWLEALVRLADWTASGAVSVGDRLVRSVSSGTRWEELRPRGQDLVVEMRQIVWAGLEVSNVADYAAAVGALNVLNVHGGQLGELIKLSWVDHHPVFHVPAELDDERFFGLLASAFVVFADDFKAAGARGIKTGDNQLTVEKYRAIVTGADAKSSITHRWLSSWHNEWALNSKGEALATHPAAIWALGAAVPAGQIEKSAVLLRAVLAGRKPQGRRWDRVVQAVLGRTALAEARDSAFNVFGLDRISIPHKAKANADIGYIPVFSALALVGMAGLYPMRGRRRATGVKLAKDRGVVLSIWEHARPLSSEAIFALAATFPRRGFGDDALYGEVEHVRYGDRVNFFQSVRYVLEGS